MKKRGIHAHLWILQVAVLATAGMVWTSGIASACGTNSKSPSRACCVIAPAPDHGSCCDTDKAPTPPQPADSGAPRVFDPASSPSCECRASEPAPPAEHQGRTPTERLEAQGFGLPAAVVATIVAAPRVDRSMISNERPPKIPVYLQTSRLLN